MMLGSLLKEMGPHDWQALSWTSWIFFIFTSPQVGSGTACHLSKGMKEPSAACHHAWDFRARAGGGGTRGRGTFSSFVCVCVCQWLFLSSRPLEPDSMVRLWKIIAKISPKEKELDMVPPTLVLHMQLWRRESGVGRPCMDSLLYLPLSMDGHQSQYEPSGLLSLQSWKKQRIFTESVYLSLNANKIQNKGTYL